MTWRAHPRFTGVRRRVLKVFTGKTRHFNRIKPVAFLCGASRSVARDRLAEYLRDAHPKLLTFYADYVWAEISTHPGLNSLEMENQLGQLADVLIIVVESPGTFAELGAFSLSSELRSKLLPILHDEFRSDDSFLNTGPVRWIDKESAFAPSIWVNQSRVLECGEELSERLSRLAAPKRTALEQLATSPKHLMFHVADLVTVFGPTPLEDVCDYLNETVGNPIPVQGHSLLGMAKATGLVKSFVASNRVSYYFRPMENGKAATFQWNASASIASLRAQVLDVVQSIPEAADVLSEMGKHV